MTAVFDKQISYFLLEIFSSRTFLLPKIPKMSATVEILRKILFEVEPPKHLVNRKTEMPFLGSASVDILKNPNFQNLQIVMTQYFEQMVGWLKSGGW